MVILETDSVTKRYQAGGRLLTVLDSVSLRVRDAEFLVIEGESGSGKSTLLAVLSGLERPDAGRVFLKGREITHLGEDALAPMRNASFGFVFQSFHLVPSLSTLENVMFPAELRRDPQARQKSRELLERVGLTARAASFPHQLSGGEKQRCAICRALVNDPAIVFADEPTGNLDSLNGTAVLELLLELHRERRTTLVLVTHNREIALLADRIITLKDGRIIREEDHV